MLGGQSSECSRPTHHRTVCLCTLACGMHTSHENMHGMLNQSDQTCNAAASDAVVVSFMLAPYWRFVLTAASKTVFSTQLI